MMNARKRLGDLDALVDLTAHMLSRARAGEWDGMAEIERQRFALLQMALAEPVAPAEASAVAVRLARILELDKDIGALAIATRDEAAVQLRGLREGQRAHQAYTGV